MQDGAEAYETLAGVIVAAHGVQGTLKVRPSTPTAASLFTPKGEGDTKPRLPVWIGSSPAKGELYHVVSAKRQAPKGGYLVRLAEVDDRTIAEGLIGRNLYTPDTRRAPLDTDEYFVDDLIGLRAVTEAGRDLGIVTRVIAQPANDIYETDQEVLIPAVKAFIAEVDLAGRRLLVHDVPGLLPSEQEEA